MHPVSTQGIIDNLRVPLADDIMPYIKQFSNEEATGIVKRELEKAIKRAGRVWNIVRIMSQNGRVMQESMEMYSALMHGESPLSRQQREMLAVVVSKINHCVY